MVRDAAPFSAIGIGPEGRSRVPAPPAIPRKLNSMARLPRQLDDRCMRGDRLLVTDAIPGSSRPPCRPARRHLAPLSVPSRAEPYSPPPIAAIRKLIAPIFGGFWNSARPRPPRGTRPPGRRLPWHLRPPAQLEHMSPKASPSSLSGPHRRRMRTAIPSSGRSSRRSYADQQVRAFPDRDALLRLANAVLVEIDEDWATSDRIYINWHSPYA